MVFVFGGLLSNLMTVLAVSESSFLYLLETVMAVCFLPRRARLLKQQRLERQKSATARRQMLETQQKERRKKGGHVECSQGEKKKSYKLSIFSVSTEGKFILKFYA